MFVVVFSGLVYLPVVGIGYAGAPNVSAQAALIAFAGVAALPAVAYLVKERFFPPTPVVLLIVSSLWLSLSALVGPDPFSGLLRGGWFACVALAMWHGVCIAGVTNVLRSAAFALALFILLGIFLYPVADVQVDEIQILLDEAIFPWPRFRGIGANQSVIGLSGCLLVLSLFAIHRRVGVPMSVFLAVVGLVGIAASHNRSAIGALVAGVVAEAFHATRRWTVVVCAICLFGLGAAALLPSSVDLLDRGSRTSTEFNYYSSEESDRLTGRLDVWERALRHGMGSPLVGRGIGSFDQHAKAEFESETISWHPAHAHSVVFELFADQGVVGLVIFGAAIVSLIRRRRTWTVGLTALLAAILSHSLVESVFSASPSARWSILVLVAAAGQDADPSETDQARDEYRASVGSEAAP